MAALKPGQRTQRFMYGLFGTECTVDLEQRDGYFEHVRKLNVLSKYVQSVKPMTK